MSYAWSKGLHTFRVDEQLNCMEGVYDGDNTLTSSVCYADHIAYEPGENILMPNGVWAQEGYMTTNPTRQGLGYMISFAAASVAIRDRVNFIYVSSGSVAGGGSALIKKLGGKFDLDLEFNTSKGNRVKLPGYLIRTSDMIKFSAEGWKNKGWTLTEARD
ncbi:hypothetical protein GCM10007094_11950 [Pseudovibrio japonicus]|uniref:Uncharacterized protein n=1 Tax=Pseudovibrio japonicus TaxID=366534 RepID=A0ABQ3E3U4_9HYPH|nr:hypothetical protein [Pseudovibrio japonicus]GHB25470.1 hypothetical protein GCM10007094_11950 [Pseudovibrio japonicus]